MSDSQSMRILHCLRAPVGGLFRHVRDLAAAQAERGHAVGIVCDSTTGGEFERSRLAALEEHCQLGVYRLPMSRQIGLSDFSATWRVRALAAAAGADVLHGHGAKGGAYARLAGASLKRRGHSLITLYTPHGGSLHYSPERLSGRVFLSLERHLAQHTDGILFESGYSKGVYEEKVGPLACPHEVVPNGLAEDEFQAIITDVDAADFLFIGELRHLKGVDLLLNALADLARDKAEVTALIVGSGPDETAYRRLASRLGLDGRVTFAGPMPARLAFARGRCLVMPSRAESFPYVVLEAAAAGMPLIATKVGGIPEITANTSCDLIPPDDPAALGRRMRHFLEDPDRFVAEAEELRARVAQRFTIERMADSITRFYRRLLRTSR